MLYSAKQVVALGLLLTLPGCASRPAPTPMALMPVSSTPDPLVAAFYPAAAAFAPLSGTLETPPTANQTDRPFATPTTDLPGLPNFAKVSDALYRGAQPTPEGFARLKRMGIKTVVNLRGFTSDTDEMRGAGLRYTHIYSKAWNPRDRNIARFLKIVSDPANRPVFVHCRHGADRTGAAVAAYRIVEQGWEITEAADEMHNFGFHTAWWQITRYLKRFDGEAMKRKVTTVTVPRVIGVK